MVKGGGGEFIILNSCSSSIPMKMGFFCNHPLWPPSHTYRNLKWHKCLTTWVALPVQGKSEGRTRFDSSGALLYPVVDCENVWHYPLITCEKFFPFSKCMETEECFHISAHLNFLCSTCYQNISLLNSSVGSESMLSLNKTHTRSTV